MFDNSEQNNDDLRGNGEVNIYDGLKNNIILLYEKLQFL